MCVGEENSEHVADSVVNAWYTADVSLLFRFRSKRADYRSCLNVYADTCARAGFKHVFTFIFYARTVFLDGCLANGVNFAESTRHDTFKSRSFNILHETRAGGVRGRWRLRVVRGEI